MTKYEVRFIVYQYNGGGTIKNGDQLCKETFNTLELAKTFYNDLLVKLKKGDTNEWAEQYVWSGFLHRVEGIYEITEVKIM